MTSGLWMLCATHALYHFFDIFFFFLNTPEPVTIDYSALFAQNPLQLSAVKYGYNKLLYLNNHSI